MLQAADGAGAGDAGREHLLDAGVANGDQCELSGHKEGVGQDEQADSDKFEQRKALHLAVRIALCLAFPAWVRRSVPGRWSARCPTMQLPHATSTAAAPRMPAGLAQIGTGAGEFA